MKESIGCDKVRKEKDNIKKKKTKRKINMKNKGIKIEIMM